MKEKVLLGMSGGVDSSVSAMLLKKVGYEVIGCTMNLLDEPNEEAIKDAKKVCEKLGIEHYVFDCRKEFRCYVIDTFISELIFIFPFYLLVLFHNLLISFQKFALNF